jgi:hypothetical protein
MYGTEDAADRDLRRLQLTKRLVSHQARTQTIYRLTGYTRHRLATLRRRWRVSKDTRHRGPAPTSYAIFFRSPGIRSEAASAAAIFGLFGGPSRSERFTSNSIDLDSGERLCEMFEAFHACFPGSELEFDQLFLLAIGMSKRDVIDLGSCSHCAGTLLIDRLTTHRRICVLCQRRTMSGESGLPAATADSADKDDLIEPRDTQGKLF